MPIATYPVSLPQTPNYQGYQESHQDNLIRNETGVGPPKTRPRSTMARKDITWPMTLDQVQKEALQDFFESTLVFGSLEFQHRLPDDANTDAIYKFRSPPSTASIGAGRWNVDLSLEIVRLA